MGSTVIDIKTAIDHVVNRRHLSTDEMAAVMREIMTGAATQAQIGGFLVALRMKGETVDEIVGAARVMRELSTRVNIDAPRLVDTCGTGGDGAGLFNVSTASSFVAAAAGAKVAKHGNRSVTSSSGSADVLETAGVNLELTPEQVARAVEQVGVGFMFAVKHHGAMKHAIGPRRELGIRTIFNVLGPLTNPAGAKHQVLGVYASQWLRPLAEVLQVLGATHALAVHADDHLDEISLSAPTHVVELRHGTLSEYTITPEQFGIARQSIATLKVNDARQSLALIHAALAGEGAAADIVALNAGAAIYCADVTDTLANGVKLAQDVIASGQAAEKFREFIDFTQAVSL
jgi:anthranilate phosphoribosyltransferase